MASKRHKPEEIVTKLRQVDGVEFLYPDEYYLQYAPHILERTSLPLTLKAEMRWYGYKEEQGTNPDGLGILRYTNYMPGEDKRALFVEIDKGTETINPNDKKIKTLSFWKDTSILQKDVI